MYKISIEIKSGNRIAAQFQSREIEGDEPALRFSDKWKLECTSTEAMLDYIEKTLWYQKGTIGTALDDADMKAYKNFRKKAMADFPKVKAVQEFTVKIDCDGDTYKNTFRF